MLWFGESWGAPICEPTDHRPTPVGAPCSWCEEAITELDQGLTWKGSAENGGDLHHHRDCFTREIVGSVVHQMRLCRCFGGPLEDSGGSNRRQEAIEAAELYRRTKGAMPGRA